MQTSQLQPTSHTCRTLSNCALSLTQFLTQSTVLQVLAGLYSCQQGALGWNQCPYLYQPLEAACIPWLEVSYFIFLHHSEHSSLVPSPPNCELRQEGFSRVKDPCNQVALTWIIQDNLSISTYLITFSLPFKLTYIHSSRNQTRIFLKTVILLTTFWVFSCSCLQLVIYSSASAR